MEWRSRQVGQGRVEQKKKGGKRTVTQWANTVTTAARQGAERVLRKRGRRKRSASVWRPRPRPRSRKPRVAGRGCRAAPAPKKQRASRTGARAQGLCLGSPCMPGP
eukprot:1158320-Pelagomonas_calceolata.AAC.3